MKKHILYLSILLLYSLTLSAQTVLPKPSTYLSVVDETATLTTEEKGALSNKLDAFKAETGHELVVVMINSLNGLSVESYANTLFNNWGIGKKGKDDGVLLLVAINDRRMRIETGYAAEAVLTDAESARVLDELLTPHFKQKEFYEGLEVATNYLITQLHADFGFESYALRKTKNIRGEDLSKTEKSTSSDKPILPAFWLWVLSFGLQLLAGFFILKKVKEGYLYLFLLSTFYLVGGVLMLAIFLDDSRGLYPTLIWSTAICITIYLLVLLPKKIGILLGKVLYYFFMLFMAMMFALIPSTFVLFFTESGLAIVIVFCLLTLMFFYLIVTGKIDLESSGGGGSSSYSSYGGGSSYSDYGGSYSDSSSSYSDSSYGGGSSGGGGASGSW